MDTDKRKNAGQSEEGTGKDTRRFGDEANGGHLHGNNQSAFNEKKTQEAERQDKSDYNKLDERDPMRDAGRKDI